MPLYKYRCQNCNFEKEELMSTLQDTVQDLEKEQSRLESIKNKTTGFSEG